ncbi:MAG: F0F1 ATP synthase subunit delta [Gammaproteobacteria bacterium]
MEFTWTTFVFEIINFVILVWILKHYFYTPVLNVIARRRDEIQQTLDKARDIHTRAEETQQRYESRLADWEAEKRAAQEQLHDQLDEERKQQQEALRASLEEQRKKAQVTEQRRLGDLAREQEIRAIEQAARFAARLLERVSGPELEARLVQLVADDLAKLSGEQLEALRAAMHGEAEPVVVSSAYELPQGLREHLQAALASALGNEAVQCRFRCEPDLLAGLRVSVGPWVLRANLQDELQFFAETGHGPD